MGSQMEVGPMEVPFVCPMEARHDEHSASPFLRVILKPQQDGKGWHQHISLHFTVKVKAVKALGLSKISGLKRSRFTSRNEDKHR